MGGSKGPKPTLCQSESQPPPITKSSTTSVRSVAKHKRQDHELVGARIRKRFQDGSWCNGVIVSVKEELAKINYNNHSTENLPLDEKFEFWRVAYEMYKLPSEFPCKVDPPLFPRGHNSKPYTLDQFHGLMRYAEQNHGGATFEDLEDSYLVRKKPGSKNTEVYGRMMPCATERIIREYMNLQKSDVLVDIGHGVGYLCLQAAYTVGCQVRGIECDRLRNTVSQVLASRLEDPVRIHKIRDRMKFTPGSITFKHGDLQDPKHRDFLTKDATRIFFNNYNGIFSGERGLVENLEHDVAALFASTQEGTIMITLSPLRAALGCKPLKEAIQARQRLNLPLPEATDASFYEVEEFPLGFINEVFNFAAETSSQADCMKAETKCYLYLRTHQRTKAASFLCNTPDCPMAQGATPVNAVRYFPTESKDGVNEKAAVIGSCGCGVSERLLRTRS